MNDNARRNNLLRRALGRVRRLPRSGYNRIKNRIRYGPLAKYLRYSERVYGWTRGDEAVALARAAYGLPANAVLVEIGSFLGSGAILMAGARHARGNGVLHCVDPFDGSGDDFSIPHYDAVRKKLTVSQREQFESNIREYGVSANVKVHVGTAESVGSTWNSPIDLLFLDGDQSPRGARLSFDLWSPHLKVGGIIAVHNSAERKYDDTHDGHRLLVIDLIRPPEFDNVHCIGTTTFATKSAHRSAPRQIVAEITPSPNCDDRPENTVVDTVVLHATVLDSLEDVIRHFSEPASKVSAHYTIGRDGIIVSHVPEAKRAWHAGQSRMEDGRTQVNDFSIGIELVNRNDGVDPFPGAQIQSLRGLLKSIRSRHNIQHIVPHYACADPPGRKSDPNGFDESWIRDA